VNLVGPVRQDGADEPSDDERGRGHQADLVAVDVQTEVEIARPRALRNRGEPSGFGKLAAPLIAAAMRRAKPQKTPAPQADARGAPQTPSTTCAFARSRSSRRDARDWDIIRARAIQLAGRFVGSDAPTGRPGS
jgi:hypothetical protein